VNQFQIPNSEFQNSSVFSDRVREHVFQRRHVGRRCRTWTCSAAASGTDAAHHRRPERTRASRLHRVAWQSRPARRRAAWQPRIRNGRPILVPRVPDADHWVCIVHRCGRSRPPRAERATPLPSPSSRRDRLGRCRTSCLKSPRLSEALARRACRDPAPIALRVPWPATAASVCSAAGFQRTSHVLSPLPATSWTGFLVVVRANRTPRAEMLPRPA